jgi:hypothetical protein
MRKHLRPMARAKSARRKSKRGKHATLPSNPVAGVAILGIGMAAAIFVANYKNEKNISDTTRIEQKIASTPEIDEIPQPEIQSAEHEIITSSIPPHQAVPVPLPTPNPRASRKKPTRDKVEKSFFSLFSFPQNNGIQKR